MLVAALDLDPDRDRARTFLRAIYPALRRASDFFFTFRDPAG